MATAINTKIITTAITMTAIRDSTTTETLLTSSINNKEKYTIHVQYIAKTQV